MPKSEYPGVRIEELSDRPVSIPGVATSTSKDDGVEVEKIKGPHSIPDVASHGGFDADVGLLGEAPPDIPNRKRPVKYHGPDFDSSGTEVAIEPVELIPDDCEPRND